MGWMKDETGLGKTAANFVPMTPLSHLRRAAHVFSDTDAVVYGNFRKTYAEYYERATRLASALTKMGVEPGDVVATLLPNIPAHAEAHFGVPACGAVLNTINTRLEAETIAYIFDHGEAKVVLVDPQFIPVTAQAIEMMEGPAPTIIEVADDQAGVHSIGDYTEYEDFIAGGDPDFKWMMPEDEWESLALNYTSGTTGRPKGVVYHHRGAYLLTLGTAITWPLPRHTRYLTIVPLFHCNNWNHTWALPMVGGTLVCCRDITATAIYDAIADEGVTHFGAAPIVLSMIVNAKDEERRDFDHTVSVFTAGAPPPAATLRAIEPLGFDVTQVYGLTETYGHVTECMWHDKWNDQPEEERYAIKARTGILMPFMEDITAMDAETMTQVPMDGETQGEVMIRGNSVMKGYLKNPEATAEAFEGGYFHSGDLAYQHEDGYLKIADRAKDIIISGGENISSIEVEGALMKHPAVLLCAVVAMPDEKWGEVPCAFVELKDGVEATEEELIGFVREKLAGFKSPKKVVFQELPKTSTGKIQKFELRKAFK
ncbi:long-chain-fatty-acid--CoA ligase [Roseovarius rhodophyticola]|uniref:Long-chain-fatty-acid--CoA ligase n=1 Tax=Roseovarius rhodophyticola TaxID=3080827 RepID=A0ABZ2TC32_9RHOB|nr:long-chain-fatty-acid--CoA ligase [Roseovarius sp. W115]MDV2930969.1 long-chain-fatty-acid--CoA ligase [Roseovarius sp. W115]